MTVAEFFKKFDISNFPPISEDVDVYSHSAVKGYFLFALDDYFTSYDASIDGNTLNFMREEFNFSDFDGLFCSLCVCLDKYTPDQAEAKYHLFNSLVLE